MGHCYYYMGYPRFIYPGRVDLFDSMRLTAHWVWQRREAAKRSGMSFSEETITDTILLDLATLSSGEIRIFPFNKHQEGKNGADWEWCFYDIKTSTYQQMLVQAKLLDDEDVQYSHIDRYIGSSGVRQIDRLISTSRRRRVPAIYAFYNHLSDRSRIPAHVCGCLDCEECWGCSVALADAVKFTLPAKSFDALKEHSRPWACLLCPAKAQRRPAPARALATLRDLHDRSRRTFRDSGVSFENVVPPPENPSSEPPSYFKRLSSIEMADGAIDSGSILAQIAAENPNIDGIVLATDQTTDR